MAFELEEGEEVISSFAIEDIELASHLAVAMKGIEDLGTEIRMEIDALDLKKSRHEFMTRNMWSEVFKKYPDKHPSKTKGPASYYKYNPDESSVLRIKVKKESQ